MYFIDTAAIKRFFNPIGTISEIFEGVYRYSSKLNGHDLKARSQLYTSYFLLVVATGHQLATIVFVPSLRSPRVSIILLDMNYMFGIDRLVLVFLALNNLVTIHLLQIMYQLLPKTLIGQTLKNILVDDCREFILGHQFNHNLINYFIRCLNSVSLPLYFHLISSYLWTCHMYWQHLPRPLSLESLVSLDFVLDLVCLLVCTTLANIGLSLYVQICLMFAALQVTTCMLIFQRFQLTKQIITVDRLSISRRRMLRRNLRFLRENVHSIRAVFSHNGSLVKGLLSYLFVSGPMNACLAVALVKGHIGSFMFVSFTALFFGQLVGIIGIHMLAADYSKRVHPPFQRIHSDYVHLLSHRCSIHDRLKISNSLAAFLTRKPYGLTYFGYGLISVFSFVKFLFIYSRLVMFSFKYFG